MTDHVRAHLIISGRVQGVFFRMETRNTAQRLGVKGWVRNRPDGTVEAVAEGPKTTVEDFIEWCRSGPDMARVDDVRIAWEKGNGAFDRFSIR